MIHSLIALDPGLARCGAVVADVIKGEAFVRSVSVFTSEPRAKDFGIHVARDRSRRTRDFVRWLHTLGTFGAPRPVAIVAEAMSFPRGINAITALALAWGAVVSFSEERGIPIIDATPSWWRTELIGAPSKGRNRASIEARERAAHAIVVQRIPTIIPHVRKLPREHQLHVLDAGGVLAWSLDTREIRELTR
jgi:hypothetical protein